MAAIKSAPETVRFDRLRHLLGQHRTAAFDLARWQAIQVSPNETWRSPAIVAAKVGEQERKLAALDQRIANEMRKLTGIESGVLRIKAA